MNIAMICFTLTGAVTQARLKEGLEKENDTVFAACKSRYLEGSIPERIGDWTGANWDKDAVIVIGATGIAVRAIAPYIKGKKTDPAVLCVDEMGKHVISLLSGHLGGANALCLRAARILEAEPIISTATDLEGKFAVDVFASVNDCRIFPMEEAKQVSAALLAGKRVGIYSAFELGGDLPEGLVLCDVNGRDAGGAEHEIGIAVTIHRDEKPFAKTAYVVPRGAVLGMGCRKGQTPEAVREAAMDGLCRAGIFKEAAVCLASIDLKKDEAGLISLAGELGIPFVTYSAQELMTAEGDFTPSAFVKNITGVDNVCERSAVLGSGGGRLLLKKTAGGGVTIALALRERRIKF